MVIDAFAAALIGRLVSLPLAVVGGFVLGLAQRRPSLAGRILFDGTDTAPLPPHRRARLGIARTFQNLGLFDGLTVAENLMVAMDATSRRGLVADALRIPSARFEERRAREDARALRRLPACAAGARPRSPTSARSSLGSTGSSWPSSCSWPQRP